MKRLKPSDVAIATEHVDGHRCRHTYAEDFSDVKLIDTRCIVGYWVPEDEIPTLRTQTEEAAMEALEREG